MVYRQLGNSDLHVSLLSFGSHCDPAYKVKAKHGRVLNSEGQERRDRQLARSFDLGVNMVDNYENNGQWEPLARLVKAAPGQGARFDLPAVPDVRRRKHRPRREAVWPCRSLSHLPGRRREGADEGPRGLGRAPQGQEGGQAAHHRHLDAQRSDHDERTRGVRRPRLRDVSVQLHPRAHGLHGLHPRGAKEGRGPDLDQAFVCGLDREPRSAGEPGNETGRTTTCGYTATRIARCRPHWSPS